MTFRQCLDKCVSNNYHGDASSTVCSFGRSATFRQSWNGAPVRVNPSAAAPIYGQMASYDERVPADDVRRTSKTLSRVIRGIVRDRRKDSSSETSSHENYVNICYNCITGTCRPYIFFGKRHVHSVFCIVNNHWNILISYMKFSVCFYLENRRDFLHSG